MKPIRLRSCSFALLLMLLAVSAQASSLSVYTFFQGTQYPLTVYYLRGDKPGPTVFVQGGIQGDESSGFLTAQALTRANVLKGNIILVPKANTPSINTHTRAVNVDMNRRFDHDYNEYYEDRLARVVRFLVAQCGAVIHLHEGSGFHNPTYVNADRNPKRYGQSVIIDTTVFNNKIFLARLVQEVIDKLNQDVKPAEYSFHIFNTDTFNARSTFLEQRKSLTYYALSGPGIPALAIEVSKNISDLGWKVATQLKATQLFLKRFGVEVQVPQLKPEDIRSYPKGELQVKVNDQPAAGAGQSITLSPGTPLRVSCEVQKASGFDPLPAVFASDRPGVNLAAAPRMPLSPFATLDVRADGMSLVRTGLKWNGAWPEPPKQGEISFACWLNDEFKLVKAGEVLNAVQGDRIILEGIWGSPIEEVINLKGYISQPGRNDGQDAGQEIILDPGTFMRKYLPRSGSGETLVEVARETKGKTPAKFMIKLLPREVRTLTFKDSQGKLLEIAWTPGQTLSLPPGEYSLQDAQSNGKLDKLLLMLGQTPLGPGQNFRIEANGPSELTLRQSTTFGLLGSMALAPAKGPLLSLASDPVLGGLRE